MIKEFFCKNRQIILKMLKASGILLALSLLIDICTLFMTVVPFDFELVLILLFDIRIVVMNLIPIFFTMSFIYSLTGSFGAGFTVTGLIAFAIAQVNIYTMTFKDCPFVFSDIALVVEASEMLRTYSLFLGPVSIAVLVIMAITAVLCFRFLAGFKTSKKRLRGIGAAVSVLLLLSFSCVFYLSDLSGTYIATWHDEFGNQYKKGNQSMSRGVIYAFARSISEVGAVAPEGYDEKEAKRIISAYEDVPLQEDKKVHIISIMLEAYNDFSKFPSLEFNVSPYENFHKLQEDSYSGKLYTNVFAGTTINTERAFLTGFGDMDFRKMSLSHVRYLKNQGYYTEAMHPSYGWFYDRKNVNRYLGFDDFLCYENKFSEIPDESLNSSKYYGIMGDYDFFDYITEGFEKALERGQKYFNFSVTYQNHGPYAAENYSPEEYVIKKDSYNESDYNSLSNYLSGIRGTDLAIKKLRDYIDSQSEPIVLILFGDHNPFIGSGIDGYEALGIDIDTETVSGAENYYCTPYLFYANQAAKESTGKDFVGEAPTISPIFLMSELFDYMDVKGSAYLNYLSDIKKEYSVINPVYLRKNGEYILRGENTDNQTLLERQWVEYYLKNKGMK